MELVEQLNHIFYPRAIAIVGASNNPQKVGALCLQSVMEAGFVGEVYPVNPALSELRGLKVYPSIGAIPGEVDLAIVVIPAPLTITTIEECISKGIKGVVMITGGFGETGTELGADLQAKIRHIADRGGGKSHWPQYYRTGQPRLPP
ncbi:CoA-binding protein [Chloroflexota bacterium]